MDKEYSTKIIFNSKQTGQTIIIEKKGDEPKVIRNLNSKTGVSQFPTAKLEIEPTAKYSKLIALKTGDGISIHFLEGGKKYKKIHQGILSKVTVKATQEKFELLLESVSSFYKLLNHTISASDIHVKSGLREILQEILLLCEIEEKVIVSDVIANDFELLSIKNFSALSFINAICYKLDLVYDFKNGEAMIISKRSEIFNKMQNQIPIVITGDDIVSSEFEQ